ncbi:hypothetical protein MO973_03470 [Paenibacillus sp. TRM 82003]|uniref:hypothetical protein n=1 Tax=Kineococcus sp. TRM81007 TaxID=2925831 RepID=UPI001F597D82|nr:hypothetical protein [Kineococcus sp. TRM81007]MCI2239492.1 hypothetical protein [Kineococcus sp. TRM81007]MCI3919292.1 hypothetical protein [Paenibacillus sp. TRM 82003]
MSAATGPALAVAALLGGAVLLRGAGARGPAPRGQAPRRPAGRRGPRPGRRRPPPDADLLEGARLAERVAALLRAGLTPAQAWRHAVPGGVADADGGPGRAGPAPGAPEGVQAVWRLVERTGAPAAETLEQCAAGMRAEADVRAAVRAATAGAQVSARTVSLLPLAGLALGAALGAPPWEALLGTAAGRVCALAGTALLLTGRWWSARLVRSAGAAGGP